MDEALQLLTGWNTVTCFILFHLNILFLLYSPPFTTGKSVLTCAGPGCKLRRTETMESKCLGWKCWWQLLSAMMEGPSSAARTAGTHCVIHRETPLILCRVWGLCQRSSVLLSSASINYFWFNLAVPEDNLRGWIKFRGNIIYCHMEAINRWVFYFICLFLRLEFN